MSQVTTSVPDHAPDAPRTTLRLVPPLDESRTATSTPCAARPSTGMRHLDGPCQCFFGGPPPEFG